MPSLKAFHIFFILISTALCVGFGAWSLRMSQANGGTALFTLGMLSLVTALALVVYGVWFLKKIRRMGA